MLYLFLIFIGAFLLFQVQPLIAKLLLPFFGGGAAIWTACLLFFQAFLLLGYAYSHYLTKINSIKRQVLIHLALLASSLIFLPLTLNVNDDISSIPFVSGSPLMAIVVLLVLSIGLPYLLLSSTGPLIQRWLSYQDRSDRPYKLYALSNTASLLALFSYPFIFEPQLTLSHQILFWSAGYIIFAVSFARLGMKIVKQGNDLPINIEQKASKPAVSRVTIILWLLLATTGVVLLVSTTNAMTQNIPPMPFLWILPLCIYLLTFIICFHNPRWYVRWYWFVLFVISSFAAVLMFFIGSQFDIISQVIIYSVILLSSCMICHGELERLKPSIENLTLFYMNMALGGFLGSAFVAFIAQNLFSQFLEFPISVLTVYLLFYCCLGIKSSEIKEGLITQTAERSGFGSNKWLAKFAIIFFITLFVFFSYLNLLFAESNIDTSRNFYGILSVKDVQINHAMERRLIDGSTSHGTQNLAKKVDGSDDITPKSYYRANTGVAVALEQYRQQGEAMNVGIIGLGAGTLAAYGQLGDEYRFYELNPDVFLMANKYFSYLAQSKATIEVIIGDGRVSLVDELNTGKINEFDVLVVDAFSGDSIPTHLLTEEAFVIYFQQLKLEGVLAIHISNSHLNLTPLTKSLATVFNKQALYFNTNQGPSSKNKAEWVLLTNNQKFLTNSVVKKLSSHWPQGSNKNVIWTDDYSNILSVLK